MEFVKCHDDAKLPTRATQESVGYDIFSVEDVHLQPLSVTTVSTGLKLNKLPEGCYLRIAPRSGLAVKGSLSVGAGVVDPDYRGEIKVVLMTLSQPVTLPKGSKVAQVVVESCQLPEASFVHTSTSTTERGSGGFGSTDHCTRGGFSGSVV